MKKSFLNSLLSFTILIVLSCSHTKPKDQQEFERSKNPESTRSQKNNGAVKPVKNAESKNSESDNSIVDAKTKKGTWKNLLTGCKITPRAPLSNCSISSVELLGNPGYEARYDISYSHTCGGLNLAAQFSAGGAAASTKEAPSDTVSLIGNGPLRIDDPNPSRTRSYHVSPSCQLTVTAVSFQPSPGQLDAWIASKAALEQDKPFYAKLATIPSKVKILAPAFELVWRLADELTEDLQADAELANQIAPGSPTRELISRLATSGFTLDAGPSWQQRSLSDSERGALSALLEATKEILPLADCQTPEGCKENVLFVKLGSANA